MIARDLTELREIIGDCRRCPLGETRTTLVFGEGDASARIMLIGEAPGRNEDLGGRPFIGAAGKLLDELLDHAGIARSDVYIANVLKCRPPKNRNPGSTEIEMCEPFLRQQIEIIDPDVIVTLGNFATHVVLGTTTPISSLRGISAEASGRSVLPVYHPAAAIYDRTKRDVLFADFEILAGLLGEEG